MLKTIELFGFKSIREMKLDLKQINVLIGANGAGKSNLFEILKLLKSIQDNRLQFYIGQAGGANSLLHYGTNVTKQISANFCFELDQVLSWYKLQFSEAPIDTLIFAKENIELPDEIQKIGMGHKESLLNSDPSFAIADIAHYGIFQFHNTATMRGNCNINNNYYLINDASNLAAVLYKLKQTQFPYYERIIYTIRQIAPFFKDFILEPLALNPNYIQLKWQSNYSPYEFGPHQLSDGSLRTMALITLLLQPESDLPSLIALDEPEIGLHPYAINIIASLIQTASVHTQIILATQSSTFLDHFDPSDIIVVEQKHGVSYFKHLVPDSLNEWLEEYTLSELWEKNVLGGRPTQ